MFARMVAGRKVVDAMENLLPLARAFDTDATVDPAGRADRPTGSITQ